MPARLTVHPRQQASHSMVIRDGESVLVGRDLGSGLVLEDSRVSKRHARLRCTPEGWCLEDLGSKNGTSVNGAAAAGGFLEDGDWISFGGVMGRFERVTAQQVADLEAERLARIGAMAGLRERLRARLDPYDLLRRLLQSAMEVAGAERGFLMVAWPGSGLHVEVAAGFDRAMLRAPRFSGSTGAVERVLKTRAPVVVSDAQADRFLGKRPSVVAKGLRVLACIPLMQDDDLLGLIYVDGHRPGDGFTELDLAMLETLGEMAALAIAGLGMEPPLRSLPRSAAASPAEGALLSELQRRLEAVLPPRAPRPIP
jgi:hypothetical protein